MKPWSTILTELHAQDVGAPGPVGVNWQDEWLLFTAELGEQVDMNPVEILHRNATLPDGTKLVLRPGKQMELRAELPGGDDVDIEKRAHQTMGSFRQYFGSDRPQSDGPDISDDDLKRRCEASGWPFVVRSSGRLTVALETTPPVQAVVGLSGQGVRIVAGLADFGSAPVVCQRAAAVLLLEASAHVRMVRATTGEAYGFEVLFPDAPGASELAEAFSCLSTACALTANELLALQDETVANHFLLVRGWPADVHNQTKTKEGV